MFSYHSIAFTDAVKAMQEKYGSRKAYMQLEKRLHAGGLTISETEFIKERDSFYMASVGENGFPYIQHRGGPKGFLKIIDSTTLVFLDFTGNKQYITVGNLINNNNVSLILMDYPNRTRLKLYAHAQTLAIGLQPALEKELALENYAHKPERILLLHVKAFDWNCPQHITPRYTVEEIEEVITPFRDHIQALEQEIKILRSK